MNIDSVLSEIGQPQRLATDSNRSSELTRLESILNDHSNAPLCKAKALQQIQDKKLYKPDFASFSEYQKKQLKISASQIFYLCGALKVFNNLSSAELEKLPIRFAHCRPLIALPKSEQIRIWKEVQERSNDERPTLGLIKELADQSKANRKRFSRRTRSGEQLNRRNEINKVCDSLHLAFDDRNLNLHQRSILRLQRLLGSI